MTQNIAGFMVSVGLADYGTVGDYKIQEDKIVIGVSGIKSDAKQSTEQMAKTLGLAVVPVNFDGQALNLIRLEGQGYFGFVQNSEHPHVTKFVLYNETYVQNTNLKDIIPSFLNKLEEAITPHLGQIKATVDALCEEIKKEIHEDKKDTSERIQDIKENIREKASSFKHKAGNLKDKINAKIERFKK